MKRKPASISKNSGLVCRNCGKPAQIVDLLGGEAQIQQILDRLGQSGRENEIAIVRQLADEQLEGGALAGLAGLEIARRHGELVEIGEEAERH